MNNVLIVDDQPHINRVMKRALEQRGFNVEAAGHGLEALQILEKNWFEVIVTDYQMPQMDGITMGEKIRDDYPDRTVFLILTTAIADENLHKWADAMPNCIYLEKPVSVRKLGDIIQEYYEKINPESGNNA